MIRKFYKLLPICYFLLLMQITIIISIRSYMVIIVLDVGAEIIEDTSFLLESEESSKFHEEFSKHKLSENGS